MTADIALQIATTFFQFWLPVFFIWWPLYFLKQMIFD